MKNKKSELILCTTVLFLSLAGAYWFIAKEKDKKALVDKTGIETVGTVIKKSKARIDTNTPFLDYFVSFDFICEENLHTRFGFQITEEDYGIAIIGRKYKVKYLPESPITTAQIYLYEPVYSEDVNVEKERARILETYK